MYCNDWWWRRCCSGGTVTTQRHSSMTTMLRLRPHNTSHGGAYVCGDNVSTALLSTNSVILGGDGEKNPKDSWYKPGLMAVRVPVPNRQFNISGTCKQWQWRPQSHYHSDVIIVTIAHTYTLTSFNASTSQGTTWPSNNSLLFQIYTQHSEHILHFNQTVTHSNRPACTDPSSLYNRGFGCWEWFLRWCWWRWWHCYWGFTMMMHTATSTSRRCCVSL